MSTEKVNHVKQVAVIDLSRAHVETLIAVGAGGDGMSWVSMRNLTPVQFLRKAARPELLLHQNDFYEKAGRSQVGL